jgi:hypothetical protein
MSITVFSALCVVFVCSEVEEGRIAPGMRVSEAKAILAQHGAKEITKSASRVPAEGGKLWVARDGALICIAPLQGNAKVVGLLYVGTSDGRGLKEVTYYSVHSVVLGEIRGTVPRKSVRTIAELSGKWKVTEAISLGGPDISHMKGRIYTFDRTTLTIRDGGNVEARLQYRIEYKRVQESKDVSYLSITDQKLKFRMRCEMQGEELHIFDETERFELMLDRTHAARNSHFSITPWRRTAVDRCAKMKGHRGEVPGDERDRKPKGRAGQTAVAAFWRIRSERGGIVFKPFMRSRR